MNYWKSTLAVVVFSAMTSQFGISFWRFFVLLMIMVIYGYFRAREVR